MHMFNRLKARHPDLKGIHSWEAPSSFGGYELLYLFEDGSSLRQAVTFNDVMAFGDKAHAQFLALSDDAVEEARNQGFAIHATCTEKAMFEHYSKFISAHR